MRLYIAEKPSVARVIADELGIQSKDKNSITCNNNAIVTWCFGHMLEQAEPDEYTSDDVPKNAKGKKIWRMEDLPIFPEKWVLHQKKDCKEQLKVIKELLSQCDEVVNCGDPDREGQLLIDEVLEEFKCSKKTYRYWCNAQDKVSVSRALANLHDNEDHISSGVAARCRSQADWLVGMNLTRAYTIKAKQLCAMGRVQSPTLKIVVERDRAIANFKPIDYYIINVVQNLENEKASFVSELLTQDLDCTDEDNRIIDKSVADKIAKEVKNQVGEILSFTETTKKKKQPLGYSLADITAKASAKWGFTAQHTLDVCQSLYEKKVTTYPRTDCSYLPEAQFNDSKNVLEAIRLTNNELANLIDNADLTIHSKTWNTDKTTAHHSIIPTQQGLSSGLTEDEAKIYNLVAKNFIAQFYPEHEFLETEILSKITDYKFKSKGITVINEGWCICFSDDTNDNEEKEEDNQTKLPKCNAGDQTLCTNVLIKSAKTKAPSKFTEGTLIKAMENIYKYVDDENARKLLKDGDGIGTSATRANIISELKRKDYLTSKGKYIVSTATGQSTVDLIPARIKSAILTAGFEALLVKIENNELEPSVFIEKQKELVVMEIDKVKTKEIKTKTKPVLTISQEYKCQCGKGLIRRESVKKRGVYWWGCSGYPDCKQTYFDTNGKPNYANTNNNQEKNNA